MGNRVKTLETDFPRSKDPNGSNRPKKTKTNLSSMNGAEGNRVQCLTYPNLVTCDDYGSADEDLRQREGLRRLPSGSEAARESIATESARRHARTQGRARR